MNLPVLDRTEDAARYEVISGGFDRELFAAAAIGEQDRVLDIGCGYGRTTLLAAGQASGGHAVGNDVIGPMLDVARESAAAEGVHNVTFEQGDAQTHPFPSGSFDLAISRFGVMFFADSIAAFANIWRALRPGGRLAFVTVGPPDLNDLPKLLATALGGGSATAGVHSLADPERIDDVLTRAGFRNVAVNSAEATIRLGEDASAAADFILNWSAFRGVLAGADANAVDATRTALTAAARPFGGDDGIQLRSTAWLVHAVRG